MKRLLFIKNGRFYGYIKTKRELTQKIDA